MPDLRRGAVFAGHRIEGVAGRGGMGTVYRATHLALDHLVALKVIVPDLADDESFRERFKSESRIAVSLRHPNVVPIHHAGEEQGLLFVTMDLVEGPDLRRRLRSDGPLDPDAAIAILGQVAAALDVAHSRGLVHRDIKPGNVLIEPRAEGDHAYLTDFGLTKRVEAGSDAAGLTSTGAFVGTLDYVAPEQIRGDRLDARTDVYALGCVLFEMLSGGSPFAEREERVAKIYAHLQDDPPPLVRRDLAAAALDAVIARAMAKDPAARYPSAGDLARAAAAATTGEAVTEQERSVAAGPAAPTETIEIAEPPTAAGEQTAAFDPFATGEETATRSELPPPEPTLPEAAAPERVVRRSRPRWPLAAGIAALAAAAVAGFALLGGGGEGGGDDDGGGSAPPRLDPRPAGIETTVGGLPVGIAADRSGAFVATRQGAELVRVTGEGPAGPPLPLPGGGESVAIASGALWVTVPKAGSVAVAAADDVSNPASIAVAGEPRGILAAGGSVWIAALTGRSVLRLDPDQGAAAAPVTVVDGLAEPYGMALDRGVLWISERADDQLVRFELDGGAREEIDVGDNPKGVAVVGDEVWVANTDGGTISRVDRSGERAGGEIEVGGRPRAIAVGLGGVWVSNGGDPASGDGYVSVFDARTGETVRERFDVPGSPEGIAVGGGRVWVATGTGESAYAIDPR